MWHRKWTYMRLDGSSKISDRRDMVADFQTRYCGDFHQTAVTRRRFIQAELFRLNRMTGFLNRLLCSIHSVYLNCNNWSQWKFYLLNISFSCSVWSRLNDRIFQPIFIAFNQLISLELNPFLSIQSDGFICIIFDYLKWCSIDLSSYWTWLFLRFITFFECWLFRSLWITIVKASQTILTFDYFNGYYIMKVISSE